MLQNSDRLSLVALRKGCMASTLQQGRGWPVLVAAAEAGGIFWREAGCMLGMLHQAGTRADQHTEQAADARTSSRVPPPLLRQLVLPT